MKFEILLWLFRNEKFPGLSRNGPGLLPLQRCLEPSSLPARQFGVGFHSNRPSIVPSVGSPSSLRGHSTGALSVCTPATTHLRSLRSGTDILICPQTFSCPEPPGTLSRRGLGTRKRWSHCLIN